MKIALIVENKIDAGGGFNQALNACNQLFKVASSNHELVIYTSVNDTFNYFSSNNRVVKKFTPKIIDKFVALFSKNDIWELFSRFFKVLAPFERMLIKDGIDLVYFVTPSKRPLSLQIINYIFTVWDLSHRDTPEFPEVRSYDQAHLRDIQFKKILPSAILTVCDSEQLIGQIVNRYGVDRCRLLAMPYSYSPFLDAAKLSSAEEILSKYNLKPGYYFYPAQFWPHKNHYHLLRAFRKLKNLGGDEKLVLVGGDKGNYNYISSLIESWGLSEDVFSLGFVPSEDLSSLYLNCCAVVMPTYFGPTNLPPLEAWFFDKPLIYSNCCAGQAGDAALLINPDSEDSIFEALNLIKNPVITQRLIVNGRKRLEHYRVERENAELKLSDELNRYAGRRACWGHDGF